MLNDFGCQGNTYLCVVSATYQASSWRAFFHIVLVLQQCDTQFTHQCVHSPPLVICLRILSDLTVFVPQCFRYPGWYAYDIYTALSRSPRWYCNKLNFLINCMPCQIGNRPLQKLRHCKRLANNHKFGFYTSPLIYHVQTYKTRQL